MRKPVNQRPMLLGPRQGTTAERFSAAVDRFLLRAFPEREVLLRANGRVRFIRFSPLTQLAAAGALALLIPATAYSIAKNFVFLDQVVAAKEAELGTVTFAYQKLQAQVADSQARFRLITQQLEAKHAYLLSVIQHSTEPRADLQRPGDPLASLEAERRRILASREAMLTQLNQLETSLKTMPPETDPLAQPATESQLHEAVVERARVMLERGRLQARAEELQQRVIALQLGQQEVLKRISAHAAGDVGELKDLIAMTGLDPERLLARSGAKGGLGGPFVEFRADRAEMKADAQLASLTSHMDQRDELQQVLRRLPLASPIDNYSIMSSYGRRRDPINGKLAMHHGIDLGGPPKAPILSPGPGVVVFAGTNGGYGRMVEIDHGMGIRTRYGHLSAVSVRKGQRVGHRQRIGVIGSTGRSTGTHLHYEVLVNDKPHDPIKFIQAGKHVFKG